ncbi:MAG: pyruvate carboxylase [Deltaproteobacteria bacterium]|jgi:pyruvate carboxylase|nr:pyruvate carboxylase [Deltaproteobacteria bacterium]
MTEKSFEQVLEELKGKPILVTNRGIPARRICRSVRERLEAIAVMTATDVDKAAPAASAAQELLLLGPDPSAYLDLELVISLAKQHGVVGIHPGWGFASEDDSFPVLCAEAGMVFIGSSAQAMRLLGNKVQVRRLARTLDIPVVPGSDGAVDIPEARRAAAKLTYPIMLKAEGGGGGRGIFVVHNDEELETAFFKASTMAQASFGNPGVYVEKFLTRVRHIEIQVIADKYGNIFTFDERDCSVQRNNQKLIEITPSPWAGISEELRARLKDYARKLVKAVAYDSLCTVEFLITPSGSPYLIEVNTRLQVEHGITEARYGIDLVEEQIAIAFGSRLRFTEENTRPVHHAMQVRINCEDPQKNFLPNSGTITRYVSPGGPGVRLDSNLSAGYEFPSNYDSAGSLLIAYGNDWDKTIAIMRRALTEYVVGGLKTTIPFYRQVLKNDLFRAGDFDTSFIPLHPELLDYNDLAPESERLSRLIAEISAQGYNPFVQLGEYRSADTPRVAGNITIFPPLDQETELAPSPYPRGDRRALLDFVRDSGYIHFTDTTCRDNTQSNSGNRFRLAEDRLIGPYLDNCGFFSLETGGGAHFHVAMLANMTYPFSEARVWNQFAPKTLKQILIRSTNLLGYRPMPRNLMRRTAEMVCTEFQIIRCFDFLNQAENMRPLAEVVLNDATCVFEPAIALSYSPAFTVEYYLEAAESMLRLAGDVGGISPEKACVRMILGLKDMGGTCPAHFMTRLVTALRKKWPSLVLHYHRHYTDGHFIPAVGAAARAGAQIVDTSLAAVTRWYGQGEVLSTAAYLEEDLGLETRLNKKLIRDCNFVLKQIAPYYDRYTSPYFQGVDFDVRSHGMPGGATSSSQEGALKQGQIALLPYMLRFLAGTRRIVFYHDVTPGSQITWNTAFLGVTGAYARGGEEEVRHLLRILEEVAGQAEETLSESLKEERLIIYRDCNDAFRDLLLGKYGRLPLGFPPDWVYRSAFQQDWRKALARRTEIPPLEKLPDADMEGERAALKGLILREPNEEELLMYLNHPGDAVKTIEFRQRFGDPNNLPLAVWFEGLQEGTELNFTDSNGKPHNFHLLRIQRQNKLGISVVRYVLDSEFMSHDVRVGKGETSAARGTVLADPANEYHIPSPSNGDLWVVYVKAGDMVKKGQELFNISIMKQEKAVLAPFDAQVKRVLKTADFKANKKMTPVRSGELLVELAPVPARCPNPQCGKILPGKDYAFCPHCGQSTA